MESCLVDSDLPYIIISTSTIQLWLILCILIAHHFCILLIKKYDFKLIDSCKISVLSIYRIYYEYTKLIYT